MRTSQKVRGCLTWLPAYAWQRSTRHSQNPVHLIFCIADHFEPSIVPDAPRAVANRDVQERRLERWCHEIPRTMARWRDAEGFPLRHTYFYPAEQYDKALIDMLAHHCHGGWGEIEVHLHHGIKAPDTTENTRRSLLEFRDALASFKCLSQWQGRGDPRYAFVHGNFALANSARGLKCGVDSEMQILSETGCFADFTLPSSPNVSQTSKINSLYECALPLEERAPHRKGKDLRVGNPPEIYPLIIQGPLMWDFSRRKHGLPYPLIENSELTTVHPPSRKRLELWRKAAVRVAGRPDWIFVKLHCHGMDPRDESAMFGSLMNRFLHDLIEGERESNAYKVHFTTAREITNIILAACDGRDGNPGDYRDYRFLQIRVSNGNSRSINRNS